MCYTDLDILNGNFGASSNVLAVLITGDTADKVCIALLFGDIGTGGELTVGNEFASASITLSNVSVLNIFKGRNDKNNNYIIDFLFY